MWAERNLHDWQASKASLFLKQNAQDVGYLIATGKEPLKEYDKALALVKGDPDAVAGLNKGHPGKGSSRRCNRS